MIANLPLSCKDAFGFYEVAGKKFYNKLEATIYAVKNGWWPHFSFNENKFNEYDWTKEPSNNVTALYQQRARLLRSKYENIYLEFSGGADSWNMAYAFLSQGLSFDALIYRYDKNSSQDINDLSSANCAAEGKFSAYPWYQKFVELSPNLKWITHEITDDIINTWNNNYLDPLKYNLVHPGYVTKFPDILTKYPVKFDVGGKTAIVAGVDKPNIFFMDNKFYLYFPDFQVLSRAVIEKAQIDKPFDDVLFYWDADCCDLLCKQAHLLVKWFKSNPEMLTLINDRSSKNRHLYFKIVNKIVYPHYEEIWQTEKASGHYIVSHESWFKSVTQGKPAWKNWRKSCQESNNIIESTLYNNEYKKFLEKEGEFYRLPNSWSKFYFIDSL